VLQKALLRHNERAGSFSDPQNLPADDISLQPLGQMMALSGVQQSEVDHESEINPALFYHQDEAQFASDVFDPNLEALADNFMNEMPGSEAFQGTVGPLQDLSLFRFQRSGDQEMEMDYNFQFGAFPQVNAHAINNGNDAANRYSMSIPAAVVDEM
jgi:hypothetical protein